MVSREGLFDILHLIGCPPKLLNFIKSFHDGSRGTVKFDGNSSEAFDINIGVNPFQPGTHFSGSPQVTSKHVL